VAAAAGVGDRSTTMAAAYGSDKIPKGAKKGHWEKFTEWGPDTNFGVKFGMGPMQMQEAYGSFMGARGGVWDRESKGMFQEALAAQTRYGISAETSGQFARGAMPGGGFALGGQGLAEVLASATEQGLSGSQVTEYLQTLVQLAQDQERNGVKIDTFNFTRGAALLGREGVGLEGLQAQRVAGGLNQRAMQVGQQGVTNPADVMMMRAAGWDPSQGVEAYFATKNRLAEQGMSPEDMNRLIGMAAGGVQGVAGGGAETEKGLLAQFWKQGLGVSIGPSQAGEMLRYHRETGGNIPAEVLESWKRGETPGAREKLISEASAAAGRTGTLKGAAGLEAMQVGVGQQAAEVVQGAERNQLALAMSMMSNFGGGLQQLNKLVLASIGAFDQFVKAISAGQKLSGALDWLNTVMTAAGQ